MSDPITIAPELRQIALEVAASCGHDNVALNIQIGRARVVTAYFAATKGLSLDEAQVLAETIVSLVLDEVAAMRDFREVPQ